MEGEYASKIQIVLKDVKNANFAVEWRASNQYYNFTMLLDSVPLGL